MLMMVNHSSWRLIPINCWLYNNCYKSLKLQSAGRLWASLETNEVYQFTIDCKLFVTLFPNMFRIHHNHLWLLVVIVGGLSVRGTFECSTKGNTYWCWQRTCWWWSNSSHRIANKYGDNAQLSGVQRYPLQYYGYTDQAISQHPSSASKVSFQQ